jgi:hypothetical protein
MASVAGIEVHGGFELFLEQNVNKQLLRFTSAGRSNWSRGPLVFAQSFCPNRRVI